MAAAAYISTTVVGEICVALHIVGGFKTRAYGSAISNAVFKKVYQSSARLNIFVNMGSNMNDVIKVLS